MTVIYMEEMYICRKYVFTHTYLVTYKSSIHKMSLSLLYP